MISLDGRTRDLNKAAKILLCFEEENVTIEMERCGNGGRMSLGKEARRVAR